MNQQQATTRLLAAIVSAPIMVIVWGMVLTKALFDGLIWIYRAEDRRIKMQKNDAHYRR